MFWSAMERTFTLHFFHLECSGQQCRDLPYCNIFTWECSGQQCRQCRSLPYCSIFTQNDVSGISKIQLASNFQLSFNVMCHGHGETHAVCHQKDGAVAPGVEQCWSAGVENATDIVYLRLQLHQSMIQEKVTGISLHPVSWEGPSSGCEDT